MWQRVHVYRKRPVGERCSEGVDRKLDLLVKELQKYRVLLAGVQESRWFGEDVWPAADGYTCLHSHRPLPNSDDEVAARNEGMGILMDARASSAWRQGGEVWRSISSRLVVARLQWVGRGQGGIRLTLPLVLTLTVKIFSVE